REMNLILLTIAHPNFRITVEDRWFWRRPRYQAVRANPAEPGLYCLITTDPDELNDALTADKAHRPCPPP
ncbi:MAG TPA: hypothetical protein VMA95_11265, partial [Streptosporangiaceae bacterium]|nr:hypothetical protein [Streptosporangiaceae bacterium]